MSRRRKIETKKGNIIFKILGIINLIISLLFIVYIYSLNILPNKYFYPFAIAITIVAIFITLGIMKKRKNSLINVLSILFAIIISGIFIFVYDYSKKGFDFVDVISSNKEQIEEYYVVTLKENNIKNLDNLKVKKIFKFVNTLDNFDVINEIKEKDNFKFSDYSNLHLLKDDLLSKKIEAILLSSSEYTMLVDDDSNFKDKALKIFSCKHKVNTGDKLIDENEKFTIQKGKFNVYISGIDSRGSIRNVARTDANILLTVNVDTREVLITSIPRDYYVTLHFKKAKDKLTHSGVYGINETVKTVEDLLSAEINYYVRVNFSSVVNLIDAIGGIEVYSDYAFTMKEDGGYSFKKGYNYLNGAYALAFCRERNSFATGDNQRIKNQQKVIEAIIDKVTSSTTLLTRYTGILNSLKYSFQTNIDKDDISFLVKEQLDDMRGWTIKTNNLIGKSAHKTTYSAGSQKLYVMIPDEESLSDAKEKINLVLKK